MCFLCRFRVLNYNGGKPTNLMSDQTEPQRIGILSIFKSVLSSFFGVQSAKNRERDFQHGKPIHYIIVGLVMTLTFILTIWGVVKLVLHLAGV